jgi:hypothetical protein
MNEHKIKISVNMYQIYWIFNGNNTEISKFEQPSIWKTSIKLNNATEIVLLRTGSLSYDIVPPHSNKNTTLGNFLKNHLQKAVKINSNEIARESAIAMIHEGFTVELLQHIPIIHIEDAGIGNAFSPCVWLMAAIKNGYPAYCEEMDRVATSCGDLAANPHNRIKPLIADLKEINVDWIQHYLTIPPTRKDILVAICVRILYGGKKSDMHLLKQAATAVLSGLNLQKTTTYLNEGTSSAIIFKSL